MSTLSKVLLFKIAATVLFWCAPLILLPSRILEAAGIPVEANSMFLRLLGWAYLALCVGYGFSLRASLQGRRLLAPIWVGLVSNGGACVYLLYFGVTGTWDTWPWFVQGVAWGSVLATGLITGGLYVFGILGSEPVAEWPGAGR
jgi:hypothetical protein